MPAKIRTIRGFKNPDGLIDFNKSINPRGGTEGKLVFAEGNRSTKIKLYQDKNEDGKFSKKELLYKGKLDSVEYDEILNVNKVKLQKQMHSGPQTLLPHLANKRKDLIRTHQEQKR